MKCKFCEAELEEGVTLCGICGKDNAPEPEKPENEKKPETVKVANPALLTVGIACLVVLVAIFVAIIVKNLPSGQETDPTQPQLETPATVDPTVPQLTEPTEPTVPPTSPADTLEDNVTHKGSYTVSDEDAVAKGNDVVATVGDVQLTNGQLQIYYWMELNSFLGQYGQYIALMGMDLSLPLDSQICGMSTEGLTWQQYFLQAALDNWATYQALAIEAEANEFQLQQEYLDVLDTFRESLEEEAVYAGYADGAEYIADSVGAAATVDHYESFLRQYYMGGAYFDKLGEEFDPTDEEVEAYFDENAEGYAANNLTKDTHTIDVRHILIMPQGATNENIRTEQFSDEAYAWARQQAQALMEEYLAGDRSEESFAELAKVHGTDGTASIGGLMAEVSKGQMVEAFDAWCFDPARQVGDCELVDTEFGTHLVYFSKANDPIWPSVARQDLITKMGSDLLTSIMEKYPIDVDYAAIALGTADTYK